MRAGCAQGAMQVLHILTILLLRTHFLMSKHLIYARMRCVLSVKAVVNPGLPLTLVLYLNDHFAFFDLEMCNVGRIDSLV